MTFYVLFETATRRVVRSGHCSAEDLPLQATQAETTVVETTNIIEDEFFEE